MVVPIVPWLVVGETHCLLLVEIGELNMCERYCEHQQNDAERTELLANSMAIATHCLCSIMRVVIVLLYEYQKACILKAFFGFHRAIFEDNLTIPNPGLHIGVDCGQNDFG